MFATRRRFLCPLCLWPLSKFHVRNRHKSYGHILNLCASQPPSHSPHTHSVLFRASTASRFAAVFCGLDYLVCGTSFGVEAAGDFLLIFAMSCLLNSSRCCRYCCCCCSRPAQSFLIKTSCSKLKAFAVTQMTASRKCFNSQRPHGAAVAVGPSLSGCTPFDYPCP